MTIKVLLIAEQANPEWVSVPLVGWMNFKALRQLKEVDVHLVTQVRNKEAIERVGYREGVDFTSIDSEKIAARAYKLSMMLGAKDGKGWTIGTAISSLTYYYFEKLVWEKFAEKIKNKSFDVVHRVTPLTPTAQSSLATKCSRYKVPFVLGPLNGGVPWPRAFDSARRQEREWLSYVRGIYKLLPNRVKTLRHASLIIAGSTATQSEIPGRFQDKTIFIPENGIEAKHLQWREGVYADKLRICFTGRLVPYKGADMLLEALIPYLKAGSVQLDMIGDGPEKTKLQEMISANSVEKSVVMHGWLSHNDVLIQMRESDVFGFPSIREFGGGVVIEAMSRGLVPLIVDYAGPGDLVGEKTGYKVPLGDRTQIIYGIRKVVDEIIRNKEQLISLSHSGHDYIRKYLTWESKAEQYLACYRWVIKGCSGVPPLIQFDN